MNRAVGQFLDRFLVANQGVEPERQPGQQWICLPCFRYVARHGRHRLRMPLFRNPRSQVVGQQPDAVTAPEERHVPGENFGQQCQQLRFRPRLDRIARSRVVADAAWSAADNDSRIIVQRKALRQRPRLHPVPTNLRFTQMAFFEESAEFPI